MHIEVFSDSVCPWCYIGKRHLEQALAQTDFGPADIHWRAFQLNPDLPPAGRDRHAYLDAKFGGPDAVRAIHARIQEAGRGAGIEFQFDRINRSPNTFNAHRLIRLADTQQRAATMVETLFQGYFIEGRDIGDTQTLAELARAAGVVGDIRAGLAGDEQRAQVQEDLQTAHRLGIGGVPFFIMDERYALSGAQPVAVFVQALQAARQKSRAMH
ncbi:MAG: DsbA family oxidoreductase [Gammaproteobacteria bacterium]|nr:DsbA family oxidoreductase [Gammaproteobacteria bacterium]